jgi:cell division protein FtsL
VVLTSLVVGSMVLGLVSLNVLLAQVSFRIDAAERRVTELAHEQVDLVRRQATLSAPGRIAGWAARNGMRLPDDIRSLHEPSGTPSTPAGAAAPGTGR